MLNDIRYGIRNLGKHPGLSIIVIVVLALGIGANSAIFSVVNGVLLRPLPYRDSDRLVMVWGNFLKLNIERLPAKPAEYEDYRSQGQIFEQVAAFENRSLNLTGEAPAERINGARVTTNLFSMLGAQVGEGRGFSPDENQTGDRVVILSYGFWRGHFSGNASAVGQILKLDDQDYTVIGVMPDGFQFPHSRLSFAEPAELWIPLIYSGEQVAQRQGPYFLNVISRLKSDVGLAQARAEMNALGERFEREYRGYRGPNGADGGWRITLSPLQEEAVASSRRALLLLFGAVALVLLIACANVANLLLVRAKNRQKELALRLALGASRWRITRQLLVESLILAMLGGILGLLTAIWGVDSLAALQTANLPPLRDIGVRFFQELVRRVEVLPGVEAVSLATARPLSGVARNDPFSIEGRPLDLNNPSFAGWQMVGANYFRTLGIPLVQGRDLAFQDMAEAAPPVAVINQTMANRYWPNESPIGQRITVGLPRADNPEATIIGIAKDLPHRAIDSLPEPDWYLSRPPGLPHNQTLFVRTAVNPSQLAAPIRDVVAAVDRNQAITDIKTMSDVVAGTVAPRKFNMLLFGLFAVIATLLAALGLYGVMAYSVVERTQEIGIRMALGAPKGEVLGLIIRNGAILALVGIALGLGLALGLTRLMTTLLFGITANDPATFVAVAVFLMLIALLACYVPARRATKVDLLVALRYE